MRSADIADANPNINVVAADRFAHSLAQNIRNLRLALQFAVHVPVRFAAYTTLALHPSTFPHTRAMLHESARTAIRSYSRGHIDRGLGQCYVPFAVIVSIGAAEGTRGTGCGVRCCRRKISGKSATNRRRVKILEDRTQHVVNGRLFGVVSARETQRSLWLHRASTERHLRSAFRPAVFVDEPRLRTRSRSAFRRARRAWRTADNRARDLVMPSDCMRHLMPRRRGSSSSARCRGRSGRRARG